jgi:hypothetical protein
MNKLGRLNRVMEWQPVGWQELDEFFALAMVCGGGLGEEVPGPRV